jgi:site-specific DNA-methyltransferase (adenine-specific)
MNTIQLGDSRELLKQLEDQTVNVAYFDPPFNSSRNYRLTSNKASIGFDDIYASDDEYIALIDPMVKEISRVLTKDGSMFFHISADQMLIPHMVLSKYFSTIQPIFWLRSRSKNNTKTKLGACTDVIYWCSNIDKPKFNMVYQPLDEYYAKNSYKNQDKRGNYALGHITYTKTQAPDRVKDSQKPTAEQRYYTLEHNGITYNPTYGWRMSKQDLENLIKDDRIHFPSKAGAKPYKKIYAHESSGKPCTDFWDDLHSIAQGSEERLYPTQKPEALLERIINMTSDEGDVILDPVAGSGTTGAVAARLNRNYILFDINPDSIEICKKRLDKE